MNVASHLANRLVIRGLIDGTNFGTPVDMNIVCVSHLRWDFVFQRPQHLLSRAAKSGRVLYVEERVASEGEPRVDVTMDSSGVMVALPRLPATLPLIEQNALEARLLEEIIASYVGTEYVLWYYTPMAMAFTHGLTAAAVVYDCMDELSAFAGAPSELSDREAELFRQADVVFTGGQSLYEAKRPRHPNVHAFPSSVDVAHFARAREWTAEPLEHTHIPRPRLGFFGVIDERMDYALLSGVAAARPDWHLVLVGPTAKVDPATLPSAANIHYLGPKSYGDLPGYIAGWDVAILPFARNAATRFISPTKTPEYLAAGKPVVSTSIRDVVRPYGQQGLVRIADTVTEYVAAVEAALDDDPIARCRAGDAFLTHMSWDGTWLRMQQQIERAIADRRSHRPAQVRNAS
jgi:UDP-galactopyranose mutase